MRHPLLVPALLFAVTASSLGPTPAQAQASQQQEQARQRTQNREPDQQEASASEPDRQALARRIRETVAQLQEVRAERRALEQQHATRTEELNRRIGELQRQLRDVEAKAEAAQQRVDQRRASIERSKARRKHLRNAIRSSAEAVTATANQISERIRTGIPLRRTDRGEELESIADRAEAGEAAGKAGAIDDFLSFMGEELQRAGSRKQWNEPVHLDGGDRRLQAYQIRISLVSQMFVAEDGQTVGLAANRADRPWRIGLSGEAEQQIRAALDILQQRRPPALSPVPIPHDPAGPADPTTRDPSEDANVAQGEGGSS